jgi:hypothetical protein
MFKYAYLPTFKMSKVSDDPVMVDQFTMIIKPFKR